MLINGKSFTDWDIGDIESMIGNSDFSENEYIDYKVSCAILEAADKMDKEKKQHEFRHDVCAFANADGGCLFFGIAEDKGVPSKLVGISLPADDRDRFELDRRNELATISPVSPEVKFRFLPLLDEKKYIVIVQIEKGNMVPYVYREGEDKYRFFVRHGNKKQPSSYSEVQRMFREGLSLLAEIESFRGKRIEYVRASSSLKEKPLALLQIIPDNFLSKSLNLNPYILARLGKINVGRYFSEFCRDFAVPTVDGLVHPYSRTNPYGEFCLHSNGIVEFDHVLELFGENALNSTTIFDELNKLIVGTETFYREKNICNKCYICVTILGCSGLSTGHNGFKYCGTIEQDLISCLPIEISDVSNDTIVAQARIRQLLMTCMALGITRTKNYCGYDVSDLAEF